MKIYRIPDPIYEKKLYLCIGEDTEKLARIVKKSLGKDIDTDFGAGCVFEVTAQDDTHVFLYLKRFEDNTYDRGVLVHELYHMTHEVLAICGLSPGADSEEAYAYYIDFLYRQCEPILYKHAEKQRKSKRKKAS